MQAKNVTTYCKHFGVVYNNLGKSKKAEWKQAYLAYVNLPYQLPSIPQTTVTPPNLVGSWFSLKKKPNKNIRIING